MSTYPPSPFLTPLHVPNSARAGPSNSTAIAQVQQVLDKPHGEEWIWGQDDVGLYYGTNKLPGHQVLSVQLTTHRLLFLLTPPSSPASTSTKASSPTPTSSTSLPTHTTPNPPTHLQVHLHDVRQTEFYTGFMRSSPKISLFLGKAYDRNALAQQNVQSATRKTDTNGGATTSPDLTPASTIATPTTQLDRSWTCHICSYTNPPPSDTSSTGNDTKCALCGISKSTSMSLPVSRSSTPLTGGNASGNRKGKTGGVNGNGVHKGDTGPRDRYRVEDGSPSELSSTRVSPEDGSSSGGLVSDKSVVTITESKDIACPRCTFLNHPPLPRCELCSTPLPSSSSFSSGRANPNGNTPTRSLPTPSNSTTPTPSTSSSQIDLVKISFRKGGSSEMYKRLKAVLERKAWEAKGGGDGRSNGAGGGNGVGGARYGAGNGYEEDQGGEVGNAKKAIGIDRILQDIDLESKTKDEDVQDAFKDLEALMVRAGDMVRLVQSLSTKLEQSPTTADRETPESTFIRSSLVQLGLPVPALTQDMVKSEEAYHLGLAKELGAFLTGGVDERGKRMEGVMVGRNGKGLVGLDEVWGLWNRARGVSLVPPKTLNAVLPLLQAQTHPQISTMTFHSGLSVLHTPLYSAQSFASRLLRKLQPEDDEPADGAVVTERTLSAVDIALQEGVAVGLARELVDKIEAESGLIVRDEQSAEGGGEKWQRNLISMWVWQDTNRP